jgi:hypothetical protein
MTKPSQHSPSSCHGHIHGLAILLFTSPLFLLPATSLLSPSFPPIHSHRPLRAVNDKAYFLERTSPPSTSSKPTDDNDKEWSVSPPKLPSDSFQRARLERQLRNNSAAPSSSPTDFNEWLSLPSLPLALPSTIQHNVPTQIIAGAALHALALSSLLLLLFDQWNVLAGVTSAVIGAYFAITEGEAGEYWRRVGGLTVNVGEWVSNWMVEVERGQKGEIGYIRIRCISIYLWLFVL